MQLLVERADATLVTLLDDPAGGDADAAGPFALSRALRGQLVAGREEGWQRGFLARAFERYLPMAR